ncbi:Hypothetical protein CAP_1291 [Chondromyces apiculatus DSM 436]|uniref:ATPase AAA-type core domain-containing protein n=1 Tax=Chondromyces apiculatus DSM 436 TaxID=1192034 RepID=A0A017TDR9_9BACT|nr:Hypothetical protein CAP_1291 [Chondromyces apiculatus DSM 436]
MLRRIEISNFRGLSALDVPCGAVTGIIGKNSAGKTSVLHTVRVVSEAFRLALADESIKPRVRKEDDVIEVCTKEVVHDPSRLIPLADWRQIFRDAAVGEGVHLAMNEFLGRTLQTRIVQRTAQIDAEARADLVVTYRDSNGELELSSAGAGLVSLVALYAALERIRKERAQGTRRPVVFLLDEPEAHLHPRLQGDVGEEFTSARRSSRRAATRRISRRSRRSGRATASSRCSSTPNASQPGCGSMSRSTSSKPTPCRRWSRRPSRRPMPTAGWRKKRTRVATRSIAGPRTVSSSRKRPGER